MTDDQRLKIPNWAISIIVLLICNMVALGFAAGQVTQRIDSMDREMSNQMNQTNRRLDRIEDQMIRR